MQYRTLLTTITIQVRRINELCYHDSDDGVSAYTRASLSSCSLLPYRASPLHNFQPAETGKQHPDSTVNLAQQFSMSVRGDYIAAGVGMRNRDTATSPSIFRRIPRSSRPFFIGQSSARPQRDPH